MAQSHMTGGCTEIKTIRSQVDIKAGSVCAFPCCVPELHSGVRFIGCFVFRKPCITVNPEHGTAMRTGISLVMPGNFFQAGCHANNELTDRADHGFMVAVFVFIEPGPVVVLSKVFEKTEKVLRKTVEFNHD